MSPRKERRKARTSPRKATVPRRVRALERLLAEAGAREAATAEILRAISRSPGDTQAVFETIAERARRLCGAKIALVSRFDGNLIQLVALRGVVPEAAVAVQNGFPMRPDDETVTARTVRAAAVVHVPDVLADPLYQNKAVARAMRYRASLGAPMIRDGHVIGAIFVARTRPGPFADSHIALLQTFADQAVIAIENVRLFTELEARNRELRVTLEQQTATSEILRVISRSQTDVQPVFDAIARNVLHLCDATWSTVWRCYGEIVHLVAVDAPDVADFRRRNPWLDSYPRPAARAGIVGKSILDRALIHVTDAETDERLSPRQRELTRLGGYFAIVVAPLFRDGTVIGAISVGRSRPGPFTDAHIALLQTFADQAVIAIENVRLFSELQQKNDALTEAHAQVSSALERQTATAEILRVISSSPRDLQPVLDTVARSAARYCTARDVAILRTDGGQLRGSAGVGPFVEDIARMEGGLDRLLIPISRGSVSGRAVVDRRTVHVHDLAAAAEDEFPVGLDLQRRYGHRTLVATPLLREGVPVGVIVLFRTEARPFSDEQIALLKTFADQAVIAIENARLFTELATRNAELTVALEQQTATGEILRVIASTTTDLEPVFQTIVDSAVRLCDGAVGGTMLFDGELIHLAAHRGFTPEGEAAYRRTFPLRPTRANLSGRAIVDRAIVHVPDVETDPSLPVSQALHDAQRWRAALSVPMLRDGQPIGTISVARLTPGPFSEQQITLMQTFADQAVIAIENVRLFRELEDRNRAVTDALERQMATAEVLRAISGSPTDTQPVFDTIAASAMRLCGGLYGAVFLVEGEVVHFVAHHGFTPEGVAAFRRHYPQPVSAMSGVMARAIHEMTVAHSADVRTAPDATDATRERARALGYHSIIAAPMLRDGRVVGTVNVARARIEPFSDAQIALLQTFADQAVIAIENVRLFNETKEALERQTATAEVLQVISNSVADAQPVLDKILDSCSRLIPAQSLGVNLVGEDGRLHLGAALNVGLDDQPGWTKPELDAIGKLAASVYPMTLEGTGTALAIAGGRVLNFPDVLDGDDVPLGVSAIARRLGRNYSQMMAPLMRGERGIGSIAVIRAALGGFSEKEQALLKTFADQAVIAIQNARLFNETQEALERQTATAEILKIIARSPDDVQPVFEAIARSAAQLFGSIAGILIREGDAIDLKAYAAFNMSPEDQDRSFAHMKQLYPMPFDFERNMNARAMATLQADECSDTEAEDVSEIRREHARRGGYRSYYTVPLIREGTGIGVVSIAFAQRGVRLTDAQRTLLRTFADQAVIAIENVRLFNATKEALEHQTAAAEVLQVISGSVSDTAPVFDKIIRSCEKLFGVRYANVALLGDDGMMRMVQDFASSDLSEAEIASRKAVQAQFPRPARDSIHGYAIHKREVLHYPDVGNGPGVPQGLRASVTLPGGAGVNYSALYAPMMWEGKGIGAIGVHRFPPAPFADKDIRLLKTFADQAAIAIENARLFNETKEALERQTATAEILKVIASSPSDVQPVFDAIVESAARLFGRRAALRLIEADGLRRRAVSDASSAQLQGEELIPIDEDSLGGRVVLERRAMQVVDTRGPDAPPFAKSHGHKWNFRSNAAAPLVRDGKSIGMISVNAPEPGALSDKQMALLGTFADQAVIAIENVRLFKELQSRTEALTKSVGQLTALGEVGQAISSSLDLETVLRTIVSRAVLLTGMDAGSIYEYDEHAEVYRLQAAEKMAPEMVEAVRATPIRKGDGATGRTAETLEPVQVPDILDDSYHGSRKDNLLRTGYRAVLAVPLLREGHLLGALQVFRRTPGPFATEVVELLETFATQSAMAIQNARLFREIAEKGKQLEEASRHKSQFLASMSHELRTPLNAILGLNEMLLGEVYGEVPEDMKPPLAQTQASGRHLLGLINNVLDLAKIEANRLELALAPYVVQDLLASVRATLAPLAAEKGLAFTASAPDDLPVAHGDAGRLTQCLINLAGNALKFTKEGRVELRVEPVEDRLRFSVADTGIGIAPDKIADLFTEFKQTDATIAREYGGTGLGLAITRKFIELHKGSIWVESELGRGSTFIFEIPLQVRA